MDYLTLFLVVSIFLLIFSIKTSKNVLSPESIFMILYVFSICCAYYSKENWGFEMSSKTFLTLISGMLTFLIVSFLTKMKNVDKEKNYKPVEIRISLAKSLILLIIYFLFSSIYIYYLCKISNTYNLLKVGSVYRNMSLSSGTQVPMLARFCLLTVRVISTVLTCVVINNIFSKSFKKNHGILLLFLIGIYILLTIISGERTSSLRIIAVGVLAFGIFWQRSNGFKRLESMRMIVVCTICALLLLVAFSSIRYFVGRSSELNIFDYISLYAGGPIYNFDHFIKSFVKPTMSGSSTFLGLFNNFARLGFGTIHSVHREVVTISSKGLYLGNVYTCFYDYYKDFGFCGMILLTSFYSFFINKLYMRAKYAVKNPILKTTLYTYFGTTLFFVSFTEQFYSTYIAISTIESLFIMIFMIFFLSASNKDGAGTKVKIL